MILLTLYLLCANNLSLKLVFLMFQTAFLLTF